MKKDDFLDKIYHTDYFRHEKVLREIADWALTKDEDVKSYYRYEEKAVDSDGKERYWIATDKRVVQLYFDNEDGGYKTLFYNNQEVFVKQDFSIRGDNIKDAYPIRLNCKGREIEFSPLGDLEKLEGEEEERFISFMMDVTNRVVNS